MNYSPFDKDTDCQKCVGCVRCEDSRFHGRKNCPMYRPGYKEETEGINLKRYTQQQIGGGYREKD